MQETTMEREARERLYRYLGADSAGEAPLLVKSLEAIPMVPPKAAAPVYPAMPGADEEAPLGLDDLDALERELDNEPDEMVERMRRGMDATLDEAEVRQLLTQARAALQRPASTLATLESTKRFDPELLATLPENFDFPGRTSTIPIQPANTQFETKRDALGWLIHAGPLWLRQRFHARKADFRWAEDFPSRFVYEMPTNGQPIELALLSDFGTGLYHSRYIAHHLAVQPPEYLFHLGDVYYAGKPSEFAQRFTGVLDPLLPFTRLFMLNANHEMLSSGRSYFDYIDAKRGRPELQQAQEGSYFCLRSERFQIVGIDTAYHQDGRHKERRLTEWLRARLEEGRAAGRKNILLSANEPYDLGKPITELLDKDLAEFVARGWIDLWFWGNNHYCALFDLSTKAPFIGSCIGHGGYPYDRQNEAAARGTPATPRFLETEARFPAWTRVRQDRGNNGFVRLLLNPDGSIELRYIDWMRTLRHEAVLIPAPGTGRLEFAAPPERTLEATFEGADQHPTQQERPDTLH